MPTSNWNCSPLAIQPSEMTDVFWVSKCLINDGEKLYWLNPWAVKVHTNEARMGGIAHQSSSSLQKASSSSISTPWNSWLKQGEEGLLKWL